jgi:hypothetical protein
MKRWASTEREKSVNRASSEHQHSIKRASTILGVASCIIQQRYYCIHPESKYWPHLGAIWSLSMLLQRKLCINRASTEHQQSVNNLGCCILYNPRAVLWHRPIINVIAAVMSKRHHDMVISPVWKWASTERQRISVLHLASSIGYATAFTHNRSIGSLYTQYHMCQYCNSSQWASTEHQQSINRASTEHQHRVNRVSTECQWFCMLHLLWSPGSGMAYTQNQCIGSHYEQKRSRHGHIPSLKMSVNRASTI